MTITEYMSNTGCTLAELARRCECEASTLADLRSGRRTPSLALALRIKAATGGKVRPEDFTPQPVGVK